MNTNAARITWQPAMKTLSMPVIARRFSLFVAVGAVCTALQYFLLWLLVRDLHWHVIIASSLGFAASAVTNYLLNYNLTFASTRHHVESAPRFAVVALAGLFLNGAVMLVGISVLEWHYMVSQVLATTVVLFWNFIVNLKWSFATPTH